MNESLNTVDGIYQDQKNPLKRCKMTPLNEKAQALWNNYTAYKDKMSTATDTEIAPWVITDAIKKYTAQLEAF